MAWLVSVLLLLSACQPAAPDAPQTQVPASPAPLWMPPPTTTPRPLSAPPTPLAASAVPSATAFTPATNTPLPAHTPFVLGLSAGGRPIQAVRVGPADPATPVLLLVGGVHGGYEAHTTDLVQALADHYARTSVGLPPGVALLLVPALNPDGVARAGAAEGRLNGHGVDLNRNWGCGWQPTAQWRLGPVDPGPAPFSEPETRALRTLILHQPIAASLFFHAAADGVFAGHCADAPSVPHASRALAAAFGDAAGYTHDQAYTAAPVTGSAPAWLAGQGIAAADVELASAYAIELPRHRDGVDAVLAWLAASG